MKLSSIYLSLSMALTFSYSVAQAGTQDLEVRWLASDGRLLETRTLDFNAVQDLPQTEVVTGTPWTNGKHRFAGPALGSLASLVEPPPAVAEIMALNDYSAEIPAEDWLENGAILAVTLDGEAMEISDKGPYWIIYPIDSSPEFDTQEFRSRMVWQVKRIDFIAK